MLVVMPREAPLGTSSPNHISCVRQQFGVRVTDKWFVLSMCSPDMDCKLRRKSSAQMKGEGGDMRGRTKSVNALTGSLEQVKSSGGSSSDISESINDFSKRKKSAANLTRRQSSIKKRENRDIPLY